MNQELEFLDFNGLEDHHKTELLMFLRPLSKNPDVEFPWDSNSDKINTLSKGDRTFLNVFAPSFQSTFISNTYSSKDVPISNLQCIATESYGASLPSSLEYSISNFNKFQSPNYTELNGNHIPHYVHEVTQDSDHVEALSSIQPDEVKDLPHQTKPTLLAAPYPTVSTFKLSPTVPSFVPQNTSCFVSQAPIAASKICEVVDSVTITQISSEVIQNSDISESSENATPDSTKPCVIKSNDSASYEDSTGTVNNVSSEVPCKPEKTNGEVISQAVPSASRTFADVLKSKNELRTSSTVPVAKKPVKLQDNMPVSIADVDTNGEKKSCIKEDKMALALGRHLHKLQLDFTPLKLQPRGLINRRNWCYINATLQALLACSPFYTLLRNLPLGPAVDRGKSSTPVIDSMVKLSYEFMQMKEDVEDLQPGAPFQPHAVYDMLSILKSDCLKGLQEDAEEFLSYILNGMHEEMVTVIKNYEIQNNIKSLHEDVKSNGHAEESDAEDEWQVIGAKQRGMVTRKVVERPTPVSELLGGQFKSFLTTNGNKTSASVQPFFTLQLDIQADDVSSVEQALNQMTAREPIQGYTCAKTKQEVEAFSRILLQKLPPVLILHLKRFVYNIGGGCKKVMTHTEYPINLEFKKELFSPEAKKLKRSYSYKLFAVMYHDGSEAINGHYISDIYHHGSKSWVRCDDRNISTITEAQVLLHSPPRVPYLLFYQAVNPLQGNVD